MANSFFIVPIFTAAVLWLYLLGMMAPQLPNKNLNNQITMKIPSNYQDVKRLADLFEAYYEDHYFYVITVFVSTYLVKQAFIIPGSAIMNIVGGALFGLYIGWPLCCCLTAVGATTCFLLSDIFLKPVMAGYFPDKIQYLRTEVEKNRSNLVFYLLSIRVLPITPNFLVNLLSPFLGIPLPTFFLTTLVGLMPYNFVCVQAGSLLSSLSSLDNVFGLDMMLKLSTMALVLVLPSLFNYSYQTRV